MPLGDEWLGVVRVPARMCAYVRACVQAQAFVRACVRHKIIISILCDYLSKGIITNYFYSVYISFSKVYPLKRIICTKFEIVVCSVRITFIFYQIL